MVEALAAFDVGGEKELYAGGTFTSAGGVPASSIARWNGTSWSELGSGLSSFPYAIARALVVFDDGSGDALYVGGTISSAGGVPASGIAKWTGTWSAVGAGVGSATDLAVFDDGGGDALYASTGGGDCVVKWDGTSWSPLAGGISGSIWTSGPVVHALLVFDDGSGEALYAGGDFTSAGGVAATHIAKWNGTSWSALGSLSDPTPPAVEALGAFDDGGGAALYMGTHDFGSPGVAANSIRKWDGTSWSGLGSGVDDDVHALTVFDDGSGEALFAAGYFAGAGGVTASGIARWDGAGWSALAGGVDSRSSYPVVSALAVFDDGSGPALHACGIFSTAGGVAAENVAKWDGTSWSALGSGLNSRVNAFAVFDDGSGPALYAGGIFSTAGGVPAKGVAKWDGTSWSALGSGMDGEVNALAVFDDGSGPALYAGGFFTSAGGVTVNGIAVWNGTTWSALGTGMSSINVRALAVFDDGSGPALYAGGFFTSAGGVTANGIARWDGAGWSAVGGGLTGSGGLNGGLYVLKVFDDGSGSALYAGGLFVAADGVAANNVAKWDGTSWSVLEGGGVSGGSARAMAVFDDGGGPALFIGGAFPISPAGDSYVAKWGCAAITSVPGCAGNPAKLAALAKSAPLGAPLPLRITGSDAWSGFGVVAYGAGGVDASGCGLVVPGFGELLLALAPAPKTLPAGLLASGVCDFSPLVPSTPSLAGVVVHLQGAAVDVALPQAIELTNALAVELGT